MTGVVSRFPAIIEKIKSKGYGRKVTLRMLQSTIMEECDIISEKKISRVGSAMMTLGYIRQNGAVFDVCQEEPFKFYDAEEDAKAEANKIKALLETA